jgi:hypothetical protein
MQLEEIVNARYQSSDRPAKSRKAKPTESADVAD